MNCNCGGLTRTLYRVYSDQQRIRAEQCRACGRETRWLVDLPVMRLCPTTYELVREGFRSRLST